MGKSSSKQTAGYRFKLRNHAGLTYGPIDAYREFRGGDKTAWAGRQTTSGVLPIDAPNLWGGDKDQGGIVGSLYVMMGEDDQVPNAMLVDAFGEQTAAWRGFATVAFDGLYGSNNPYPQPQSHKIEKILQGWDAGTSWYPEKGRIPFGSGTPMALYFALDTSDSMGDLETNGQTRLANMKTAMSAVIDRVQGIADAGNPVDIQIVAFWNSHASILKRNATGTDFDDLRAWLSARGHAFGTDYEQGVLDAPSFFSGAPAGAERALYFVTDGIPTRVGGTPPPDSQAITDDAVAVLAGISDLSTYAFNIGLSDTSYSAQLDNTPGDGTPVVAGGDPDAMTAAITGGIGALWTVNPAHALYYLRTQRHLGAEPTSSLNDASFRSAADQLFLEGFGICVRIDPDKESVEEIETRICKLIGGSVNRSLEDGQLYLDLARGNYVLDDLPIVGDDDILSFSEQPTSPEGAVNSVSVRYFDPERKETVITPSVDALGLIDEFGLNHQVIDYPEIPAGGLGARIATRELHNYITPSRVFDLALKPTVYALRPNQYFRLQSPKRGIADMVCIVGNKQGGTLKSGAIKMQAAQDIFTLPDLGAVEIEPGSDPSPAAKPVAISAQRAFEAPYIDVCAALTSQELAALPDDAGYLVAIAEDPANSRDFTVSVDAGGGYAEQADGDWCPTAVVNEAADVAATNYTLSAGKRLGEVVVGSIALWGDELCRVDAIDVAAGTITLGRACGDTVQQEHSAGTKIWFYGEGAAYDTTEYSDGETVAVKLLTNSWSQRLALAAATPLSVAFDQRQARPYPPGKVRVAGGTAPATVTGAFNVTWTHRDRVQQANQLLDTEGGSVGPEVSVRYGIAFYRVDTNALLVQRTDLGSNAAAVTLAYTGDVRMQLWSISNNGESWQRHERTFAYTPPGGATSSTISGTEYIPDDGVTIIDGNDPPPTTSSGSGSTSADVADGGQATIGTSLSLTIGATVIDPCASPYNASPTASAAANAAAFNAAFAALPVGGGTVQPSVLGDYTFDTANPILPVSHSRLRFPAGCRMKAAGTTFVTSPTNGRHLVRLDGVTHVEIEVARATGYRAYWAANGGAGAFGVSEWSHWLFITNSTTMVNVLPSTAVDFVGDAISIGRSCSNIWIGGLVTRNNRRQGVSNGGDNVTLEDCDIGYIGGSDGTAPMAGVDNEVDDPATYASTGMVMNRCRVHHCSGPGVNLYKSANNVTLTDLVSEYNQRGVVGTDSDNVTINGSATALRYNRYEGLYVTASCTTWSVRADFYFNKTTQFPSQAGTGTTSAPTSTLKGKNAYVASSVSGLSYAGGTTWGPV